MHFAVASFFFAYKVPAVRPRNLAPHSSITAAEENELLAKARGDAGPLGRNALSKLLQAHQSSLAAVIRILVGHPKDLQDVLQEALVEAFTNLESSATLPFSSWLRGLAVQKSGEFLALQRKWRPAAQLAVQEYCAATETTLDVVNTFKEEGFAFDAKAHVSFCFTAVGRALPMEEQFVVVLVDVLGLSQKETARVLRINDDSLTRFLANGRTNLELLFGRLCGLVDVKNPCDLCRGLRAVAPENVRGVDPDTFGLDSGSAEERLHRRLKIVSEADLDAGPTHGLHDFLFELMSQNEANRETPKEHDEHLPTAPSRWEDLQTFNN